MKKHISVLSVILTVVIVLSSAVPAVALDTTGFEAREVTTYLYEMDKTTTLTLLFNRDLPEIPYINMLDYFGIAKICEFNCNKNDNGTYTISNDCGAMTVDIVNDTAVIENSENFLIGYGYVPEGSFFDHDQYVWAYVVESTEFTPLYLDFGKYGIDIIEKDGAVYFPVSVLNDLVVLSYVAAEYIDGCLYFTVTFTNPDGYFDRSPVYTITERSEAFAEFAYNELCFQFDNFYGCPSAAPIGALVEELGFDKALDAYSDETRLAKQLLKSTSNVDFHLGLCILSKPFFDGGHTVIALDMFTEIDITSKLCTFMTENLLHNTEEKWIAASDALSYCRSYLDYSRNLRAEKTNAEEKYEKALEWEDIAYLVICGDTAVFSFDMFSNDVLEPLSQALAYAKEQGVRNFVIDLTTNGGGLTTVVTYILALITNKNTQCAAVSEYELFQNSGTMLKLINCVDVNLDKEYNELDGELIYDFNFALLTSKYTFSAANQLSVRAKENGVMMIGETSGGGGCTVTKFYTPGCELIRSSMYYKAVLENGGDTDRGAEVDVDLRKPYTGEFDAEKYGTDDPAEAGFYDYSGFFDFESLEKLIDEFYDRGDVNNDGEKNNKDVVKLFRYVSAASLPEYLTAYDYNCDGKVDNKDIASLFRYLSTVK